MTYAHWNGLPYALKHVTKTFIGAVSMFSNGFLMGEAGSATIARLSHQRMIPVVAFSETFKFCKKAMLDKYITAESVSHKFRYNSTDITRVEIKYDVTPAKYIDMVTCEVGCFPAITVPVII